MKKEIKENIKRIIKRNLMWKTKGAFPYWNEDDLKDARLEILKELNTYIDSLCD